MSTIENIELQVDYPHAYEYLEGVFRDHHESYFESTNGVMSFQNDVGVTHELLLKETSVFPSAVVSVSMRRTFDTYRLHYVLEYTNGTYKLLDVLLDYTTTFDKTIRSLPEEVQTTIYEAVVAFYRTVDTVHAYEEGSYEVNVNHDKVITVELPVDEYAVKATKRGQEVSIELIG